MPAQNVPTEPNAEAHHRSLTREGRTMTNLTPDEAELRRLAEACPMPDFDPDTLSEWYEFEDLTERNYPIPPIDAAFIAAASPAVVLGLLGERDALAAKAAECEALMVELQPDPVLVGDSWIPFRDLAEVCGNFMRSSTEYAREAKALAAAVERVRALAGRIDRHTEVEPDPAMFRDADTGVWWEVSDVIRAALDATPDTGGESLAHMTEARDNARAEVERLTGQIESAKRVCLGTHLGRPWAGVLNDVLRALGGEQS